MFNKNQFAKLINDIKQTYSSQEEFSKYSGIGRTYISQYMNCRIDTPPKPKILEKIANASKGITTYEDLMHICGYIDLIDSVFSTSVNQNNNNIPVVNKISYKNKSFVTDNIIGYILMNSDLENDNSYFAYQINDSSMLPLLDTGDIAIISKQNEYKDGQTFLIMLDEKDVMIRKTIEKDNNLELQAINPYYPIIRLINPAELNRIKIIGKVVKAENKSAFK